MPEPDPPSESMFLPDTHSEEPMDVVFTEYRRNYPVIAWIVIGLLVATIVAMHMQPAPEPPEKQDANPIGIMLMEMQGKYIIATSELMHVAPQPRAQVEKVEKDLYRSIEPLNSGTIGQRQRFAILAADLLGPAKGAQLLDELSNKAAQQQVEWTDEQTHRQIVLAQIFDDYRAGNFAAPQITGDERSDLLKDFGWFGELALAPKGGSQADRAAALAPAWRLLGIIFAAFALLGTLGIGGLVGLILLGVRASSGKTLLRFATGTGRGGFYAETFALWMLLFLGFSLLAELVMTPATGMLFQGIAFFASLLALVWPVLRGIPWRTVREDIGWTGGPRILFTLIQGVITYAMTLPLLAIGMMVMLFLIMLQSAFAGGAGADSFDPTSLPSHPIVNDLRNGGWLQRLQILFLASIAAPVVEETVFRGLLYRHLRESSRRWGRLLSALTSAFLTSFIFAVIHPQGVIAVPALMGIAFGLTLAREWQDTLLPSMFAHGIHNGLLLVVLTFAMG